MRLVGDAEAMAHHGAGLLALAELMPRETSGLALAVRADDNVDADADADDTASTASAHADLHAVAGIDVQPDSGTTVAVSTDRQTQPDAQVASHAEPIADFDALFNDDPVDVMWRCLLCGVPSRRGRRY